MQYKATVTPWVGLRKINVSYWCWEDMSPFTNGSLGWLPGEPSDAGFCAYLERAPAQVQGAGVRANPCTAATDGLICEKPAGEEESPSDLNQVLITGAAKQVKTTSVT